MWLFDARIAELRKSHCFRVKIESHPDSDISGRREGRVLIDQEPLTHPIPRSIPANVHVEYAVKKKNEVRVEMLPVNTLGVTKPKVKARHAVIRGDRAGDTVIYIRSDKESGQVHKEGARQDIFYVAKSDICVLEDL